ncbi:MAG: bifunctional riboflavin kinase/FAD synthetase [Gammaproteobacteria bacterium]|nr:bifunctional riboflavin kinase/FAD synthetase [Gammaproteobacteria bacterium]
MRLLRGLRSGQALTGCVATIGNFDGVHLGHQAMITQLCSEARTRELPSVVISFEPLPHEYFLDLNSVTTSGEPPYRLQGLRNRIQSLQSLGVDYFLLLPFDASLAAESATDFIQRVLVDALQVKHLIVGDDFRFGHKRQGDLAMLRSAGARSGYTVVEQQTVTLLEHRISSSRVRECLQKSDLSAAAELLGRPYRISGRVIHGEKVGRQLGFPTANVALKGLIPPLRGVFAVMAEVQESEQRFKAVANLGERPTIGGRALLLEVYLLDQNMDLYAKHLHVDFLAHIRGEQKFESLDELKAQIAQDAEDAAECLENPAMVRNPNNRIH